MHILDKRQFLFSKMNVIFVSALIYSILCAVTFHEIDLNSPYADAKNYMEAGLSFRNNGFLSDFGNVRTYGYPSWLAIISFLSGPSLTGLRFLSGLVQCTAYFGAAIWLASEIHRKDTRLSGAILLGLSANIFNIALLGDAMTEAPSLIIALALTTISLRAARANNQRLLLIWFVVGCILASFDLMIRPANIVAVVAWGIAGMALWWNGSRRRLTGSTLIVSAAAIGASVLAPQIYYNLKFFHRFTPLPTIDLGNGQAKFGIEMMKYATSLSENGARPVVYRNPLYDGAPLLEGAFQWYLHHPLAGLGTTLLHIFNSFNFDYQNVYIRNLNSPLSTTIGFFTWVVILMGSYHLCSRRRIILKRCFDQPESVACLLFLIALCGGTILLNSTVAVENRFNLVPTSVLIVSAVALIISRADMYQPHNLIVLTFTVAAAIVALAGSEWAKSYSAPIMQARLSAKVQFPERLACGDTWDAAQLRPGQGFSAPEKDGVGSFRWTVAHTASIAVTPCFGPAEVEVEVAFALTQTNISDLQISFVGQTVKFLACKNALGTSLRGHINTFSDRDSHNPELTISVPKLDVIAGASREFGVAIRSIAIHPDGFELGPSAGSRRCS